MVYPISKLILWPILQLFIKKIDGIENLPRRPFILVANHASYIDGVILMMLVAWHRNRQLCYFATNEYFLGPFWNALFNHFGAIRVNGSLERGLKALKQGKCMSLFPEGTRTYTGKIGKVTHKGLGVLALLSRAPVVPANLSTYYFWNRLSRFPNFKKNIKVAIGKPMSFKGKVTKPTAMKVVNTVMKEVAQLA